MSTMELSYIAGVFDSEGCVRINRRVRYGKPGEARKACEMYILYTQITNLDPRLVYPLKEMFGGSVQIGTHKNPRQRNTFIWMASSRDALSFLKAIRPWLVSKADQADIAIDFQSAKRRHGKPKGGLPTRIRERERQQYADISALKFRVYDPVELGMVANSGELQNGQPRAKQGESLGVCND